MNIIPNAFAFGVSECKWIFSMMKLRKGNILYQSCLRNQNIMFFVWLRSDKYMDLYLKFLWEMLILSRSFVKIWFDHIWVGDPLILPLFLRKINCLRLSAKLILFYLGKALWILIQMDFVWGFSFGIQICWTELTIFGLLYFIKQQLSFEWYEWYKSLPFVMQY